MNVLMISPGYPTEINYFTRGLAVQGARVFGIGDQPERDLPDMVRQHLAGYVQASSLLDEAAVVKQERQREGGQPRRQVGGFWETGVILAARLREGPGLPRPDGAPASA